VSDESLAGRLAMIARELPAGHVIAWADVLRSAHGPYPDVEAALIDARPGYTLGAPAARLIDTWRRDAPTLPGAALALALLSAAEVVAHQEQQRSTVVVSGPTTDAVAVRLTREVVIDVIRAAESSILLVSFAAYGVGEVVRELTAAAARDVEIDLVLESTIGEGGTLVGDAGGVEVFRELEGKARFWHWPQRHRPVAGRSRAALHAKLIAADDRMAFLGSANLTDRALAHNIEIGLVLSERDAVRRLVRHFRGLMSATHGPLTPL
jgi:putative cardiolipin synthase